VQGKRFGLSPHLPTSLAPLLLSPPCPFCLLPLSQSPRVPRGAPEFPRGGPQFPGGPQASLLPCLCCNLLPCGPQDVEQHFGFRRNQLLFCPSLCSAPILTSVRICRNCCLILPVLCACSSNCTQPQLKHRLVVLLGEIARYLLIWLPARDHAHAYKTRCYARTVPNLRRQASGALTTACLCIR